MSHPALRPVFALAVMLLPFLAGAAVSPADTTPAFCADAARVAAMRHGVPARIMRAITLVETRRNVGGVSGPWPWTLNVAGHGYWYDTRAEALAHAKREIAGGQRLVDLGCFQLNYRWHGENFAALDDMLDPALAADYAARFLRQLFAETGDWMRAAGLYHSRTPVRARRYRGLIGRALASLDSAPEIPAVPAPAPSSVPRTPEPAQPEPAKPEPAQPEPAQPGPALPEPAQAEPAPAIVLASARVGAVPEPGIIPGIVPAAAPGAVILRMFASPARPLFGAAGPKP